MTALNAMVQPFHEAPACGLIKRMYLCFAQLSVSLHPLRGRRRASECAPLGGLVKRPGMGTLRQVPRLNRAKHRIPVRTLITA
ncbi:hypothetical protein D3C81_1348570 [compost metagenome]